MTPIQNEQELGEFLQKRKRELELLRPASRESTNVNIEGDPLESEMGEPFQHPSPFDVIKSIPGGFRNARQRQLESMSPEQRELHEQLKDQPDLFPWWMMVGGAGATSMAAKAGLARKLIPSRPRGSKISNVAQKGKPRDIPQERAATSALTAEKNAIQAKKAEEIAEATRIARETARMERLARTSNLATPTRIQRALQSERVLAPRIASTTKAAKTAQDISNIRSSQAMQAASTARGASEAASIIQSTRQFTPIYQQGVELGNKILTSPTNPSELNRIFLGLDDLTANEIRLGMLESFSESVSNLPRLTNIAQQRLLSPAGRANLRQALSGMPDDMFDRFMLLIERGRWQKARDVAIKVGAAYQILRHGGRALWNAVTGDY